MDPGTLKLLTDETREVFVETTAYRRVEETLKTHGHVTISGASGEGKTSMALMLGDKYRRQKYELVFVDNINKFTFSLRKTGKIIIIIDDIFGSVGLTTDVSQLNRVLQYLHLHLRKMITSDNEKTLQVQQRRSKRKMSFNFHVVFTTKPYNLQKAIPQVHGHASHAISHEHVFGFFEEPTVLDVTRTPSCRYSVSEKKNIFKKHQICQNIDVNVDVEDICKPDNTIFGFPLTCSLYFKYEKFQRNPVEFFSKPLYYLRLELSKLLFPIDHKSAALILMLLMESNLNLSHLEMESDNETLEMNLKAVHCIVKSASRTEMAKEARNFRGTFFTDGDNISFSHPAIYDACTCALFKINPSFVLRHCSIKFLYERVQPHPVQSTAIDDHLHIIYVSEQYHDIIASRLAGAVCQGKFSMSISHPILKVDKIVDKVFEILECKLDIITRQNNLAHQKIFHSKEKEKFFLHWAVHAQSLYLVKKILDYPIRPTEIELNEAVEACVSCANIPVLEFLCEDSNRNISRIVIGKALMKASEIGNFSMFKCLVSIAEDLTFPMKNGGNLLHAACEGGDKRIVQHVLPSFDINCCGDDGSTPLMVAARTGKSEIVDLLVKKGADLKMTDNDGNTVLHLACEGGNVSIVENLLPSFDINCRGPNGQTPVMLAAYMGEKEAFAFLQSKGADLKLTDNDGYTVLHLACEGGNISIVENLLPSFDINCRGDKGQTPVMSAALSGEKEAFDLLVSKAGDLKLTDNSGNTVLHFACQGGNVLIVENLLPSFDINCRGLNGQTPAMSAALSGEKEAFDFLVSNGADLKLIDSNRHTVFHLACMVGSESIAENLLPLFDINCRGLNGLTPVMWAAFMGDKGTFDLLVSKGPDFKLTDNSGNTILHLACQGGNVSIAENLLQSFDINCRGQRGWTPVMSAVQKRKKEAFDLLVSKGADLKLTDNKGDTVLHLACQGGNVSIVENLLPSFDINCRGHKGQTPVMSAVFSGEKEAFDLLVSKAADLKLTDNSGNTVLHFACQGGNVLIVESLLPSFDIDCRGLNGQTPVMSAAFSGKKEAFAFLQSKGADFKLTDNDSDTVLHLACQGGNISIVENLLPSFDINCRGHEGQTPLMSAAFSGRKEAFAFLQSKGADFKLTDNDGNTVLHLACEGGNVSIVENLLPSFDINCRGPNGQTPVMLAAYMGEKEAFAFLQSKGADLKLIDNDGNTVLHLACKGGNVSIVENLLPSFDINCRGHEGQTPLMSAAFSGRKEAFAFLQSKGADFKLTDNDGNTVLHLACEGGNVSIVENLLPSFDINCRGLNGQTPAMSAALSGEKEAFAFLQSKGADFKLTDYDGNTVLHFACQGGNVLIVENLLPSFDINCRGLNGQTPAMSAALSGEKEAFDFLVSNGADLKLIDSNRHTVFHLACMVGSESIAENLLPLFDINCRGLNGLTPVMWAAFMGDKGTFDLLVSKGPDFKLTDNSGNTILHLACQGGNVSIAENLLQSFDINCRGQRGWTPVMSAVQKRKKQAFDLLVSKGADLKLTDNKGDTVLHLACQGGNVSIVENLLPSFDINCRGHKGQTPVMSAVFSGEKEAFDLLVSKAADLKLTDNSGNTVLHFACQGGNVLIVESLLPSFDIDCRGLNGQTPVMSAAFSGKKEAFAFLQSKGADFKLTDNDGDTVLHLACQGGNISIVENLLPSFDINCRGHEGQTPVMSAAFSGRKEAFAFLQSKGADVKLTDNDGNTVLHLACKGGNVSIVENLLPSFDINCRGHEGQTPLMSAAFSGRKEAFAFLQSKGADFKLTDNDGNTVLHLACEGGNVSIVENLLPSFDINCRGLNGQTPAMSAALSGEKEAFAFLQSKGADFKLTDYDGNTVLHFACQGGNVLIVENLLPSFDINCRGLNGQTPAMSAALSGEKEAFDFLVSNGADLKLIDSNRHTVFHLACMVGSESIAENLLPLFDINCRGLNGLTPVMWAAFMGDKGTFDLLVSKGPDFKLTDNSGNTILHLACQGGNVSIAENLLQSFDINCRGQRGWTPVMSAVQKRKKQAFDLLVSKGADLKLTDNKGDTVLHLACQGGNVSIVENLLPSFDINCRGHKGQTPVMSAVFSGEKEAFDLLVSKAADLKLTDNSGNTVLHFACQGGNVLIVESLLPSFDIDCRGLNGQTPVMSAAFSGKKEAFAFLQSKGADFKLTDNDSDTVLHLACQGGNISIVENLLPSFDINCRGHEGQTPLMSAAFSGRKEAFAFLQSKGADFKLTDNDGNTVLHLACEGGNVSIVENLLPSFDINCRGPNGQTPVMLAAYMGEKEAFAFLQSKGADLKLTDYDGNTVLHRACEGGNVSIAENLLPSFDINCRGLNGQTPATSAAFSGRKEAFAFLQSKGADFKLTDNDGNTVLHFACQGGNVLIVENLLPSFDINCRGLNGQTPAMSAALSGEKEAFDFLVSNGADFKLTDNDGNTVLHLACEGGNVSIVENLLQSFDINCRGQRGWTPVMSAVQKRKKQAFDLLVSKGADLKLTDNKGDTVLHLACQGGNVSIVENLLPSFDINCRGHKGQTPVMSAVFSGEKEAFDLLVSKAADLKLTDNSGNTVLHFACQGGNVLIVESLLPSFDIDCRGLNGQTPVMSAAFSGKKEAFAFLQSKGADFKLTDNDGDTVLHLACQGGNISIVENLLPSFDINCRGHEGQTPLMSAAFSGRKEAFAFLQSKGADFKLTDNDGDTVLHLACQGGNISIVENLLPSFDINCRGHEGQTPLMSAAFSGRKEAFAFLQSKGADFKLTDNDGNTVLHFACQGGNVLIVENLLPSFDINCRGHEGQTPLMSAAFSGRKEAFAFLQSKGADFKLTDNDGNTVLHFACQGGNVLIVENLLPSFDINCRGLNGQTPAMSAALSGEKEAFDFLVSNGADFKLTDNDGNTVLHLACEGGNVSIVENLLPSFDINCRGPFGQTPVMLAAYMGEKEAFAFLQSKGADLKLTDYDGNTVLHCACEGGNVSIAENLLPSFDINCRGLNGQTPAMSAALSGEKEAFAFLQSKGADFKLTDNDGNTVLHLTCKGGNVSIVENLLPSFDINCRGHKGQTPVMSAAFSGRKEAFAFLQSKGADFKLTDNDGNTVLHLACEGGNVSIVENLLPSFDINCRGPNGRTPVMLAAYMGEKEAFAFLQSKGADLKLTDYDGNTVLHLACQGGNVSIAENLLQSFDINCRGQRGWTPVMSAVQKGKKEAFDLLVSKGADLKLTDDSGDTALHLACQGGNIFIVECLLPSFDINCRGHKGQTPVMSAAFSGEKEAFDLLVSKGADLKLTDEIGDTVLHLASQGGNVSMTMFLLPLFDINCRGGIGWTPIMMAVYKGKNNVFELLVVKGADLTLTDNNGDTVLHLASQGGNASIVETLLPSFDINCRGQNGLTPILMAAEIGKNDVFDLLVTKGADLTLTSNDGDTVLHLACHGGNIFIVENSLPSFDINCRGQNGWTPLMFAAASRKNEVFDILMSKVVDLTLTNNYGDAVIHLACYGGNVSIVEKLLPFFDINCRGQNGLTPLMIAAENGKKEALDHLVTNGADLTLTDNYGDTVFHFACQGGNENAVHYLLPFFDINVKDTHKHTPLMRTVVGGSLKLFDLLLSHHADFTLVDNDGDGLLHLACEAGNFDMVKHVLPYSDVNMTDKLGWTPPMVALVCGHPEIFLYLVDEGADLTVVDNVGDGVLTLAQYGGCVDVMQGLVPAFNEKQNTEKWTTLMCHLVFGYLSCLKKYEPGSEELIQRDGFGDTLLHLACRGGNTQCVEHLLPCYDINVRGRYGWTPVMMAACCGHLDVFQCLLSLQADLSLVSDTGEDVLILAQQGRHTDIVIHLQTLPEFKFRI